MLEKNEQLDFLKALLTGNKLVCSEISNNLVKNKIPTRDLYENIFKKSLYEVGSLWENGKISVATEHLAAAIVEANLNEHYATLVNSVKTDKTIVGACVENEFHQIGIKMVTDIFEMYGWNTFFLGANTPTNELISFLTKIKPNVLALSLSLYFNIPILERMIVDIRKEFPTLPIIVGGQAFAHGGNDILKKYQNIVFIPDLYHIDQFILNFKKDE